MAKGGHAALAGEAGETTPAAGRPLLELARPLVADALGALTPANESLGLAVEFTDLPPLDEAADWRKYNIEERAVLEAILSQPGVVLSRIDIGSLFPEWRNDGGRKYVTAELLKKVGKDTILRPRWFHNSKPTASRLYCYGRAFTADTDEGIHQEATEYDEPFGHPGSVALHALSLASDGTGTADVSAASPAAPPPYTFVSPDGTLFDPGSSANGDRSTDELGAAGNIVSDAEDLRVHVAQQVLDFTGPAEVVTSDGRDEVTDLAADAPPDETAAEAEEPLNEPEDPPDPSVAATIETMIAGAIPEQEAAPPVADDQPDDGPEAPTQPTAPSLTISLKGDVIYFRAGGRRVDVDPDASGALTPQTRIAMQRMAPSVVSFEDLGRSLGLYPNAVRALLDRIRRFVDRHLPDYVLQETQEGDDDDPQMMWGITPKRRPVVKPVMSEPTPETDPTLATS